MPSLKYVINEEFDVVKGNCVIDIEKNGLYPDVTFIMLDTGDFYSYMDMPDLDAYGKGVPYYCEVTLTKDHAFEIGYKIYDIETRELIVTGK